MSMDLQRFADSSQEKTEDATPKRLEEARKRGQIAKSMELVSAVTLLATWGVLQFVGSYMTREMASFMQETYALIAHPSFTDADVGALIRRVVTLGTLLSLPIIGAALISGLLANYLQVGFVFTFEPIKPQFSRVNPLEGFKRIFSRRSLVEMGKGLLKLTIIGWIAYAAVRDDIGHFASLMDQPASATVGAVMAVISKLFLRVGLATATLALFDFFYQRYEFRQQLKMTKQEIKEEFKQTEGSPEIRGAIRRRQRELARRRMMEDVKKADVVITNPTHFAIALRYRASEMAAPRVLAKGEGLVAQRIKEVAREADIPLVENKPLAQTLFRTVEIGHAIPQELFQAVAEVLAFVYRLKGRVI